MATYRVPMQLTELPLELFKKITQFLNPTDYTRLYRTNRLLYSKRQPFNFQPPAQNLDRFLRQAPLQAIKNLATADWTEEAIVVAFIRGLPVCQTLIRNEQVSDRQYTLQRSDMPECLSTSQRFAGDTGETLSTICAMFGHTELIEMLLDNGFDINRGSNYYMTSLGCAIIEQYPDTCRFLIQMGARMDFVGDSRSAIHLAAEYGTPEILEILVNAGEDVDLDSEEETPLHKAAYYGTVENVQWLLEHGADLWMRAPNNLSTLDCSVSNEDPAVFVYLLQRYLESDPPEYWKEDALAHAALARNLKACQKLLDLGASVNGNPYSSKTPLFKSVHVSYNGKFRQDIFDLLMQYDPDLYVGDASKRCPLIIAAYDNLENALEKLIEKDPKIVEWACREGSFGALHAAAENSSLKSCQLLINHGVDVNAKDDNGRTPIMVSVLGRSEEATLLLIQSGADLQIRDNEGWSVMEYAIYLRDITLIQLLTEHGMQLPTEFKNRSMRGLLVLGADLMKWLRQNFSD